MVNRELENQADHAIHERLSIFSVAIDVSHDDIPYWGSGTLVKFNNRFFILTCSHVVSEQYPNEQIGVLFYAGGTLTTRTKEQIKQTSLPELVKLNKSYRQTVTIINRFYSDPLDDLLLLELDPLSEHVKKNDFYDLSKSGIRPPTPDHLIFLSGFSIELARDLGQKRIGVLPYFLKTGLSSKQIEASDFIPQTQFLIDHTVDEYSVEPKGLSGCGVWIRLPSGRNNFWTPNIYLVGVQRAVYRKDQVLVVIKAEQILKLIKLKVESEVQ